ncbi:MAG TPA: alpha/beta hydrolase family protein [Terriglobia bacterium]|nr:alpha/beta hydrolase family protein [Terriglobia bacterium]
MTRFQNMTTNSAKAYPRVRVSGLAAAGAMSLALILGVLLSAATTQAAGGQPAGATTLDCSEIQSAILGRAVNYCVALPADYASSNNRYPVLYFLHGLFENERSWADRGGKEILDGMLAKGQLGPFLMVMPDAGKTFYVNSFDGKVRYEDFFIQELVPYVDQHYRTIARPAERGIFGISMGGYGALHLAMRHPDIFGSVSTQSAALLPKFPDPLPTTGHWAFYAHLLEAAFGSPINGPYFEANNPLSLAEHPETFQNLKLYFDCGDQDRYGFDVGNKLLDQILTAKHFPHEYSLRSGGHGWDYEAQYMQYPLLFQWNVFEHANGTAAAAAGRGGRK